MYENIYDQDLVLVFIGRIRNSVNIRHQLMEVGWNTWNWVENFAEALMRFKAHFSL